VTGASDQGVGGSEGYAHEGSVNINNSNVSNASARISIGTFVWVQVVVLWGMAELALASPIHMFLMQISRVARMWAAW
jgi:hypothetical protein